MVRARLRREVMAARDVAPRPGHARSRPRPSPRAAGKPASEAAAILSRKAAMLKTNTEELQKAIAAKRDNLDVIVNSLAERAAAGRGGPAGGAGAP